MKKKADPKRKIIHIIEDVEDNIGDILVPPHKKRKKIVGGKKIHANVPTDDSVLKWKFVYHRRIALEREIKKH